MICEYNNKYADTVAHFSLRDNILYNYFSLYIIAKMCIILNKITY